MPSGITTPNGLRLLKIGTEHRFRSPYVTVMKWVDGVHAHERLTEDQAYQVGVLIARLHEVALGFESSSDSRRPIWGMNSYREALVKLERYAGTFLSEVSWSLYQLAAEKVLSQLDQMKTDDWNYGLIHADLHLGNVVFEGGLPHPIDFGRCGYGFFFTIWQRSCCHLFRTNDLKCFKDMKACGSWARIIFSHWSAFSS